MSKIVTIESQSWLDNARNGDAEAFSKLTREHYAQVWRFLFKWVKNRDDAEELAQETFMAAWRSLSRFRADSKFSTWLLGIALNLARNHHNRSASRNREVELDETAHLDMPASPGSDPQVQFEHMAAIRALDRALDRLPPDMREVMLLIKVEGLSMEQAASMLDVPLGTIKSRLSRGKEKLLEEMTGYL
ncbi:MAG: polymerase subunit sigma [Herminiimonas sp.]|nr:polymerase subunit sigma [Herminiimonas sp.]